MSSLTLAVDSSSENLFIALLDEEKALVDLRLALSQPHSQTLMTSISWILEQASVTGSQLEKLVVGCGPGAFSGLRIGMASMQGLAQALDKPLYTFLSHDLIALKFAYQAGNLAVLTDARRQQVYWSLYVSDGCNLTRMAPCRVDDPATLAELLPETDMLLVGSGVEAYKTELAGLLPDATRLGMPQSQPDLAQLINMSLVDNTNESQVGLQLAGKNLKPLYVRASDAEINRQKKLKEKLDG